MRHPVRHRRNYNIPGHAHELTFGCYKHYRFLESDRTCQWLAEAIEAARKEYEYDVWAYVFMPDHVHIIVHPRRTTYDIADIRQAIKEPVGRVAMNYLERDRRDWLPRVTRKRGQRTERLFWQSGGGYDRNVDNGDTLLEMIDYIHLNPVRRDFVQRASDWKWSSAAYFTDGDTGPIPLDPIPPDWLPGG